MVVELYVCENCSHVENELNGACPECGGVMKCVDFVPREAAQQERALDEAAAIAAVRRDLIENTMRENYSAD